jgi:hypothetical protein
MSQYETYAFNLPRIGEDGGSTLGVPPQHKEFSQLDVATEFALSRAREFDRVLLIQNSDGNQIVVRRFTDGGETT